MRGKDKLFLLITMLALGVWLAVVAFNFFSQEKDIILHRGGGQESCFASNGDWQKNVNTCLESCDYKRGKLKNGDLECHIKPTEGCICGAGRCINKNNNCEGI